MPFDGRIRYTSASLSPALVAANTSAEQTFSNIPKVQAGDMVLAFRKPTAQAGLVVTNARVVADGQIAVVFGNLTAVGITPTAAETYDIAVMAKQPN